MCHKVEKMLFLVFIGFFCIIMLFIRRRPVINRDCSSDDYRMSINFLKIVHDLFISVQFDEFQIKFFQKYYQFENNWMTVIWPNCPCLVDLNYLDIL